MEIMDWLEKRGWKIEEDSEGTTFTLIRENGLIYCSIRCEGEDLPWDDDAFREGIGEKDRFEIARHYYKGDINNFEISLCIAELVSEFIKEILYEKLALKRIKLEWEIRVRGRGEVELVHRGEEWEDSIVINLIENKFCTYQQDFTSKRKIIEEDMDFIAGLFYRFMEV